MHKRHINYSTLVLLAGIAFSFIAPSIGIALRPYIAYMLMAIMFFNFLGVSIGRIVHISSRVLKYGLFIHYILIPLIGWLFIFFFVKDSFLATGLLIAIAMPVGMTVPALVKLMGGNFEESLAMTTLFSLLAIFISPLLIWLMAGLYVKVDSVGILNSMFLFIVVPFFIAKLVEHEAHKLGRYSKEATLFFLFFILWAVIGPGAQRIITTFGEIALFLVIVLFLNITLVAITFLISRKVKEIRDEISLTMLNYKNYALAAVLASTLFNSVVVLATIAFAVMQNITLVLMFKFFERYKR